MQTFYQVAIVGILLFYLYSQSVVSGFLLGLLLLTVIIMALVQENGERFQTYTIDVPSFSIGRSSSRMPTTRPPPTRLAPVVSAPTLTLSRLPSQVTVSNLDKVNPTEFQVNSSSIATVSPPSTNITTSVNANPQTNSVRPAVVDSVNKPVSQTNSVCNPNLNLTGLVPVAQQGLTQAEQQNIIDVHNKYRALHGANPFTYDSSLAKDAQTWANQLATQGCSLQHQQNLENQGENLAYFAGSKSDTTKPVSGWYNERCDYEKSGSYQSPSFNGPPTGHFTQVVWRDTTKLGCGYATCPNNQQVWVCRYSPQGNFVFRNQEETSEAARTRVYREQVKNILQ